VALEVADFNLDARQEVRLANDRLIALVRPAQGGHIYELDVRQSTTNVLATLDRRPEAYHATIREATARLAAGEVPRGAEGSDEPVRFKQDGLDRLLVYDRHPRKALVDHFWRGDVTLDDLVADREVECGDFATGTYLARVQREARRVVLIMERTGRAGDGNIRIHKTIELKAGSSDLAVTYLLEDLPRDVCLQFAVEINLAAMAGHAPDRYYADLSGSKLGLLDDRLDLPQTSGLALTDEWLDLSVALSWSQAAGLWCFPIETVSQSEGGFEGVYQSSAVIPHWHIAADEAGRWEVSIRWRLDQARRSPAAPGESGRLLAEVSTG
jgi:alpha-amylase